MRQFENLMLRQAQHDTLFIGVLSSINPWFESYIILYVMHDKNLSILSSNDCVVFLSASLTKLFILS